MFSGMAFCRVQRPRYGLSCDVAGPGKGEGLARAKQAGEQGGAAERERSLSFSRTEAKRSAGGRMRGKGV